MMKTGSI